MNNPSQITKWWGYPGHFICASRCQFHLHTTVDGYIISTVGDMRPRDDEDGKMEAIGSDEQYFETYVFEWEGKLKSCGCCPQPKSWGEIEGERYATALQATDGHMRYVNKYLAMEKAA